MAGKRYFIYRLTSPSGRTYVGYTGTSVEERWRQHVKRAKKVSHHPLCAAIRKYGSDTFTVETLSEHGDLDEVLLAEQVAISAEPNAYNISAGGERDHLAGHVRFRELLQDPVWRADYLERLSASLRNSPYRDWWRQNMAKVGAKWRSENPKRAYKAARRAMRIATKVNHERRGITKRGPELPQRLKPKIGGTAAKKHRSRNSAAAARRQWAEMAPGKKAAVHEKISAAHSARNAAKTPEERASHEAQLAEARKSIDHSIRKARQKEAVQEYWTPERRAEFSAKRKARYAALSPEEKARKKAQLDLARACQRKAKK